MTDCRYCRYSFAGLHGLYCSLLDKHPMESCANFEREPGSDDDKIGQRFLSQSEQEAPDRALLVKGKHS